VHLISKAQVQSWPEMTKDEVAERLMKVAALHLHEGTAAPTAADVKAAR
jgi:hypothetical protein